MANSQGELVVTLHDLPLASGHYSTYLWLGGNERERFDILNNMTPPIYFDSQTTLGQGGVIEVKSTLERQKHSET